jgi:hypothetical protein
MGVYALLVGPIIALVMRVFDVTTSITSAGMSGTTSATATIIQSEQESVT